MNCNFGGPFCGKKSKKMYIKEFIHRHHYCIFCRGKVTFTPLKEQKRAKTDVYLSEKIKK